MSLMKPLSFMMLKGCLLSDTQQTISALSSKFSVSHPSSGSQLQDTCLASVMVCSRCENVIFPFPICTNSAVMDPSRNFVFANTSLAASRSFVASTVSTASSPQQIFTCLRRLLVEFASPLSKNRRTSQPFFALHLEALHSKT